MRLLIYVLTLLFPEKTESKPNYNEPSMTTLSNSFFKPVVQTQSVSALEMAPAVQQLMGKYIIMRATIWEYVTWPYTHSKDLDQPAHSQSDRSFLGIL